MKRVTAALEDPDLIEIVVQNQQLLDRLRNTLASALVDLTSAPGQRCGNCDKLACERTCHLRRLLDVMR